MVASPTLPRLPPLAVPTDPPSSPPNLSPSSVKSPKIPKIGLLGASSPHPEGKILLGAPAGLWRCPVTQPRFICVTTER